MSAGMLKCARKGPKRLPAISMIPEALNIDIPTIMATRYGIMLTETLKPSFAPSVNTSYIGTFLIKPVVSIIIKIAGSIQSEAAFIIC